MIDPVERFRGCVVGAAVGDAMAAPLESSEAARDCLDAKFATIDADEELAPVRDFLPSLELGLSPGQWSAPTQLFRVTADFLLRNGRADGDRFARALTDIPIEARRAWGVSMRKACQALSDGVLPIRSGRDAAPTNEPLSRGVALGLFEAMRASADLYYECRTLTRLTHYDSRCVTGVFVVARAVSHLVSAVLIDRDAFLGMLVEAARFAEEKAMPEDDPLSARLAAVRPGESVLEAVASHGHSEDVVESLPFAVAAFLAHSGNYEEAVVQAANAGGSAAVNAFLAGAMCGALNGFHAIPTRLRMHVEDLDGLLSTADRLVERPI